MHGQVSAGYAKSRKGVVRRSEDVCDFNRRDAFDGECIKSGSAVDR